MAKQCCQQGQRRFAQVAIAFQALMVILFGVFTDFASAPAAAGASATAPHFQNVHLVTVVGLGFLLAFAKRHTIGSLGTTLVVAALVIQWAILVQGFFECLQTEQWGTLRLNVDSLVRADFAVVAVLVTFGALLGKVTPLQLLVVAVMEVVFYAITDMVNGKELHAVDIGGGVNVHAFAAFFALAASVVLPAPTAEQEAHARPSYVSSAFAAVGTLLLWVYLPSFNAAFAPASAQTRVTVLTVLALAASCLTALAASSLRCGARFRVEDLHRATLAGGVAIASAAALLVRPFAAVLVGAVAGFVAVILNGRAARRLLPKLGMHDSVGVVALHGMPGVVAGLAAMFASFRTSTDVYGTHIGELFPARAPANATVAAALGLAPGKDWSAGSQGAHQLAALVVALSIAVVGGLVTAMAATQLRSPQRPFEDAEAWAVVAEEEAEEAAEGCESPTPGAFEVHASA